MSTADQNENDNFRQLLQGASDDFDKLCQERHAEGAERYGQFTFMENDVVRMMMEELADTANYCRMQFAKLMLLQFALEEEIGTKLQGEDGAITIGTKSFVGTKDVGWGKDKS